MNFKILSFNVKGLNNPEALGLFRNYIGSIPWLDLLCVQEHKLRLLEVENMHRYLWPCTRSWICDASLGYNNTIIDQDAGCGGIAIILS